WLDCYFNPSDRVSSRSGKKLLPAYGEVMDRAPTWVLPHVHFDWAWLLDALARNDHETLYLSAAAIRTPYAPRTRALPLLGSSMVELAVRLRSERREPGDV